MKKFYTVNTFLLFALCFGFVACKKERPPKLTIHVQEKSNAAVAKGATVHAWPSNDPPQGGSGIPNPDMDQTTTTDGSGDAVFNFKFSAVLDVDVWYYKQVPDSLNPTIFHTDTLFGHKVVKIESVRQRSSKNEYNETVEVK